MMINNKKTVLEDKMNTIIEKLKHSLEITRSELKDVWYDDKTSVLCERLLQIERNLE